MSKPPSPLEKYYLQFLEDRGVSPPSFELNDFLFQNLKVEVDNDGNASLLLKQKASKEVIEQLSSVRKHPILAGSYHYVIRMYQAQIEQWLSQNSNALPCTLYAGEYPTHSFNAEAMSTPVNNGFLALLNSGLLFFLHNASHLISFITIPDESERRGRNWVVEDSSIPPEKAAELLANLLISYFFHDFEKRPETVSHFSFNLHKGSRKANAIISPRYKVAALVGQEAAMFVLAHEFGHALRGHLTPPQVVTQDLEDGLEVVKKSWQEELEADLTAISISLRLIEESDKYGGLVSQIKCCGPLFFLVLDELVTTLALKLESLTIGGSSSTFFHETHPPAPLRMETLINELKKALPEVKPQLAGAYMTAVKSLSGEVCERVMLWVAKNPEALDCKDF